MFHSSCIPSSDCGQGLAFVWLWGPCTSGCIWLAEVCEQSRVLTGPSSLARAGPLCHSQAPAADNCGGFGLGEAPRPQQVPVGAVPAALLPFPKGGSSPHP